MGILAIVIGFILTPTVLAAVALVGVFAAAIVEKILDIFDIA